MEKIPVEEFIAPSVEELQAQARTFFKENRPTLYRDYQKKNEMAKLDAICLSRAKRAKEFAESLIQGGTYPGPAYMRAIREVILESNSD